MKLYRVRQWFNLRVPGYDGYVAPNNMVLIEVVSRSWTRQHVIAIVVLPNGQAGCEQFSSGMFEENFQEL